MPIKFNSFKTVVNTLYMTSTKISEKHKLCKSSPACWTNSFNKHDKKFATTRTMFPSGRKIRALNDHGDKENKHQSQNVSMFNQILLASVLQKIYGQHWEGHACWYWSLKGSSWGDHLWKKCRVVASRFCCCLLVCFTCFNCNTDLNPTLKPCRHCPHSTPVRLWAHWSSIRSGLKIHPGNSPLRTHLQ